MQYVDIINTLCDGQDPYFINDYSRNHLPTNVTYFDLMNYLIQQTNSVTFIEFKAYKSMESYKTFQSGWVQEMGSKSIGTGVIVYAKVKHSQRINLPPVTCWCKIDASRVVEYGHCKCLAGLGESCSHVGALLFALETWNRKFSEIAEGESCTDVLATWIQPPTKKIKFDEVQNIKFKCTQQKLGPIVTPFTDSDINDLLDDIQAHGKTSAIMTIRSPYSKKFEPKKIRIDQNDEVEENVALCQLYLQSMYKHELRTSTLEQLLVLSKDINIQYSDENIKLIEKLTKSQNKSKFWYRFRTGRITASVFRQVARTSIQKPSASLIKTICYPNMNQFLTPQMKYGQQSESSARAKYCEIANNKHKDFMLEEKGLCINNLYAHIGASPDGYVWCSCCGYGVLEIKCPYRGKDQMDHYLNCKDSAALVDENGQYVLKKTHSYYYQIQMQMFVLKCNYGDLMFWNKNECILIRVTKDQEFWDLEYPKTIKYFKQILLPELMGCYYSKNWPK